MDSTQAVQYLGNDGDFFAQLQAQIGAHGYEVDWIDETECFGDGASADWYRVLILDYDISQRDGFQLLTRVKAFHSGIPVMVVVDRDSLAMTQIAISRQNDAEAALIKPVLDWDELVETLHAAFKRLDGWRSVFQRAVGDRPSAEGEVESEVCSA